MRFELKAIEPGGAVESLEFRAPDEATAVQQLRSRGYAVLSVRAKRGFASSWHGAAKRFPVVLFSQELRLLIGAGLPLVEAVETLAEKEPRPEFRGVIERLAATLREGRPFSAALEHFPQAFSSLFVATVRAAERTSDLPSALERYVAYATTVETVRRRAVNASLYPLLLIAVGGLVTLFLLFYVVPRFAHIYVDRAPELPFLSRVLLAWGQAAEAHGALVLGALSAAVAALIYGQRHSRLRAKLGDALWRIPALGDRMKVYQLARFYRTIGMLLTAGMPLVAAMELGADLLHPVLRARLAAARCAITEGRGISESMERNGLTTPVALRMLAAGEHGGNLGEMLETIAAFHDEELARWVDRFTRLFEPVLMAVIGTIIGVIVVLMYMPIFELAGALH